jgi:hypothetical protein
MTKTVRQAMTDTLATHSGRACSVPVGTAIVTARPVEK